MERVSKGFYRHYKGDIYFVLGVGILDEDGHGDPNAPRQVIYESTRSSKTGLVNLRFEAEFTKEIEWPDGVKRARFVRVEYDKAGLPEKDWVDRLDIGHTVCAKSNGFCFEVLGFSPGFVQISQMPVGRPKAVTIEVLRKEYEHG